MATTPVEMGAPSPEDLEQDLDPTIPAGYTVPYEDGAPEEEKDPADLAPAGTPIVGATDHGGEAFEAGVVPIGGNTPLTAEQADYLNEKYEIAPAPAPAPEPPPEEEEPTP